MSVPADQPPTSTIPWSAGAWSRPPLETEVADGSLYATAIEGSDAWRQTAYGFIHDSAHALLAPFSPGQAVQVRFHADFDQQFDQAGLLIRADERTWVKAGVEYADGMLQAGAVVTSGMSDWSTGPAGDWAGRAVTVRASWKDDALTIRARADDEPFRMLRVLPFAPAAPVGAGPMLCAPSRSGLRVRFDAWQLTAADASLH